VINAVLVQPVEYSYNQDFKAYENSKYAERVRTGVTLYLVVVVVNFNPVRITLYLLGMGG
jgi:hypothetical protein